MATKRKIQVRGTKKRQQIIHAVIDCLASEGIEGTSFDAICQRTKLRRSHIIYYFPNRESLIAAAIAAAGGVAQEITATYVMKAKTPQAQVLAVADAAIDYLLLHRKPSAVMSLLYHLASTNGAYRKLHTQIREKGRARLKGILSQDKAFAKVSSKVLDHVAKEIQALISGFILEHMTTDHSNSPQSLRREIHQAMATVLAAAAHKKALVHKDKK